MKLHFILIDINKSISRSLINWQRTISQCYQTLFVCHYDRWEMKFHCHCNLHFSSYEHGWIAFRVLKVLHFYFLQTILCSLFCRAWNFFFYWFVDYGNWLLSETWAAQFLHARQSAVSCQCPLRSPAHNGGTSTSSLSITMVTQPYLHACVHAYVCACVHAQLLSRVGLFVTHGL